MPPTPTPNQSSNPDLEKARRVLRGEDCSAEEKKRLYKKLKADNKFDYARKVLTLLRAEIPNDLKLCQQHALCTYKDTELPAGKKFDRAINILREVEDIDTTKNQETLGLLGSIYKRKWVFDNNIRNLERSYIYYNRGYEEWESLMNNKKDHDYGYTAINTAFVLDLLAYTETIEAVSVNAEAEFAAMRLKKAREIRKLIIDQLPKCFDEKGYEFSKDDYWSVATVAEAYFGVENYKEAKNWLLKAKNITGVPEWEFDSTAQQLASLADIQIKMTKVDKDRLESACKDTKEYKTYKKNKEGNYPWDAKLERDLMAMRHDMAQQQLEETRTDKEKAARAAIADFLDSPQAVDSAFIGKVGLALSGGGFRASLFHIGMLAKLAELDILRHVEVISCVSGGSILGAYYYLKVLLLQEGKTDDQITRKDYINLVKELEEEFMDAVKTNIRARVFDSLIYNLKMVVTPNTTRTGRIAFLYEKYFYLPLWNEILEQRAKLNNSTSREITSSLWDVDGGRIPMRELTIKPLMKDQKGFNYKKDNWKRKNKIPNLILNATSLNTGHNWQFTATYMGEPPGSIVREVDPKYILRRMYYHEAPGDFKNISLGEAVAASAGVPAMFEPLELKNLYPDITVQLVDGGVHDNQGVVGLMEQECKVFFVSDASGQVTTNDDVGSSAAGVGLRTNEVLQGRIRESQYLDLRSRNESALIKEMLFVHLKKDLEDPPKDWYYCEDPHDATESAKAFYDRGVLTSYGIRKEIQSRLASVRTDLDAFHDAESYALMYSAYEMTGHECEPSIEKYFNDRFKEVKEKKAGETGQEYTADQGTAKKEGSDENANSSEEKIQEWNFLKIREYNENVEKSLELERLLDASGSLMFKVFKLNKNWKFWGTVILVLLGVFALCFVIANWGENAFEVTFSKIGLILLGLLVPAIIGKFIMIINNYKGSIRSFITKIILAFTGWIVSLFIRGLYTRKYLKMGELPLGDEDDGKTKLFSGILLSVAGILVLIFRDQIVDYLYYINENIQAIQLDAERYTQLLLIGCFIFGAGFIAYYFIRYYFMKTEKGTSKD